MIFALDVIMQIIVWGLWRAGPTSYLRLSKFNCVNVVIVLLNGFQFSSETTEVWHMAPLRMLSTIRLIQRIPIFRGIRAIFLTLTEARFVRFILLLAPFRSLRIVSGCSWIRLAG